MVHRVHSVLTFCFATAAALSQNAEVAPWIEQLAHPAEREAARAKLLEVGAAAASPLAARLATADAEHARACLAVLDELGPAASAAIPTLIRLLSNDTRKSRLPCANQALATLAELVLYREADLDADDLRRLSGFWARHDSEPEIVAWSASLQRLRAREMFPRRQNLDALLVLARDRRPWVVEAAIQQLGALGPAAERALPLLRGVLQRPEPRILPGDQFVPLHRCAARAMLAIAPGGVDAETARSVLAGQWTPPPPPAVPTVPERARQRIAQLLMDLAASDDATRAAAADNLVALGMLAADPVATLLAPANTDATISAALDVLRRLGKGAATAVPALAEALTALSATHTVAVLQALATTVPWSQHVFVSPTSTSSVGDLAINGRRIAGTIDVAFLNALSTEMLALHVALSTPVDGSPERLRPLLADPWVARRRRALEVIAARGSQCAALLDAVAPMLTEAQPAEVMTEQVDAQGMRSTKIDRTDQIQRLAANAILAIAPTDHPLVAKARERLARAAAK